MVHLPVVGELCPLLSQATDEGPLESGQRLLSTCCMPGFGTGQEVLREQEQLRFSVRIWPSHRGGLSGLWVTPLGACSSTHSGVTRATPIPLGELRL